MRKYMRIPTALSIEEVLSKVDENTPKYKSEVFNEVEVNIGISNLKVFKMKGVKCVGCGIEGHAFYLEKTPGNISFSIYNDWHLNLYAGHEVLMTKDHIIPRSKGGPDRLDNYQPMCEPCNRDKGDKFGTRGDNEDSKTDIYLSSALNRNDEKTRFTHCKTGMREKYEIDIDETDYVSMVHLTANSREMRTIHWLSQKKTIREIQFKGKTVWLIYNSDDRVITVMTPRTYDQYFRIVPHWAKDMEQSVLIEYDKILNDAKQIIEETGTTITTKSAKYFRMLEYPSLMFYLCKNKPIKVNSYIWSRLHRKFIGGDTPITLKGGGEQSMEPFQIKDLFAITGCHRRQDEGEISEKNAGRH